MNKKEFLSALEDGLNGLPKNDLYERLDFYSEMIDDIIEESKTEEEAVKKIGSVDKIIEEILLEYPLAKLVKDRIKPQRSLTAVEITLLIVGSPIWASLLIAFIAVVISIYASAWAVIISLWAVFGSVCAGALAGVVGCGIFITLGHGVTAIVALGLGVVSIGFSILAFYGCLYTTKGFVLLTKKLPVWIKACLLKGGAQ